MLLSLLSTDSIDLTVKYSFINTAFSNDIAKRLYCNSTLQSWLTDANSGINFQKIVSMDDNLVQ
jgi:hypothetical protein